MRRGAVKPETVKYDTALLTIGGGRNDGAAPEAPSPQSVRVAKATNSATLRAGNSAFTVSIIGMVMIPATGAKSRAGS